MEKSDNRIHAITCEKIGSSQDHHYQAHEVSKDFIKMFGLYLSKHSRKGKNPLKDHLLIKPTGKTIAEIVRMRPGALVWNHGEELVERASAQPNETKAPPIKELMNILSILMRAFFAPIRETSSVV